jgi:hypothetical protein
MLLLLLLLLLMMMMMMTSALPLQNHSTKSNYEQSNVVDESWRNRMDCTIISFTLFQR